MIRDPFKAEAELGELYYFLGKAVWYIQYLEDVICTFIALARHEKQRVSPEEAYDYLAKTRRKPLGKIVGVALSQQIVPDGLEDRLTAFVEERNWLVHRSVQQNSDDLADDTKRRLLVKRVQEIYSEAGVLAKQLAKVLFAWSSARGVDEAAADRIAIEKINKLWGGESGRPD